MKRTSLLACTVVVAFTTALPLSAAQLPAISELVQLGDGAQELLPMLAGKPLVVRARRYISAEGLKVSPQGFERADEALKAALRAHGLAIADTPGPGTAEVEIETWFYVYTMRFGARRLPLPEMAQVELEGGDLVSETSTRAAPAQADPLRVIAGAAAMLSGNVSTAFGSYMMATGARNALFGSGGAPNRSLLPDYARYKAGEQEAVSVVRMVSDGRRASVSVHITTPGDAEPFAVAPLLAANLRTVASVLRAVP